MQNMNEMMENFEQEEGVNVKAFLFRLLSKWHWFVLFGFLGLAGAYLLTRYTHPTYKMNSIVLLYEESNSMGMENLFQGFDMGGKANIQNHIGILKSYNMNHQTLENLNWRTSWFAKGVFRDGDLYGRVPYELVETPGQVNLDGIPVHIVSLKGDKYLVKVDGEAMVNGRLQKIDFEEQGKLGEVFQNTYFSFTLKGEAKSVNHTYFTFNNQSRLTLSYLRKLGVSLTNKKADMIRLQLIGSVPAREVDYLNELSRVYIQFGLKEKNRTSLNTVRFIDQQLEGIVDSLKIAGQNFTAFRSKNKVLDFGQEATQVMAKMEELEKEKSMAEMRLEYYDNLHHYVGDASQMKQMVSPSVVGITDMGLNALVIKLSELYSKREVLSYTVKEKNPSLVLLGKEIQHTRKSLEKNLENLLSNAEIEVKNLNKRMNQINAQVSHLPQTEQEMINIKRSFDLNNELYTFMLQKRAEASIAMASNVPDAQVLDAARVETAVKIGPKTALNLLVGLILGLGLPFLVIVLRDYFNDTIQSKEDIEKESKLPIFGEIAHNRYKIEMPIVEHPRSGIAESFRGLRTNLQYILKQNVDCKVVAIHSTISGEGKTFTSLNLATIIAMDNKKVLLVGCDMRKPRLHDIFSIPNKNGLSTYLIGNDSINEVITATKIENLSIVNAGPIPPNPSELLSGVEFGQFINEAKKQFDYIVLDNAPVSLVTDGIIIGKHADANLVVFRQGYSHKNQIKIINQIAEKEDTSKVGIILNDAVYNGFGYGNYGSYGYGNGYYEEDYESRSLKDKIIGRFSKN
ncbi:polysaccharide biosynthesis tyrosine autokinase [Ancylomarina sp. YFZ004]